MSEVKGDVLKLKKRGEDGNRVITVRIKEETLSEIDRIAKEVNYSRNELINTILEHGVRTIEIPCAPPPAGNGSPLCGRVYLS